MHTDKPHCRLYTCGHTCANWKAIAPDPYWEEATRPLASLITLAVVLMGSPTGSPSVMAITWKATCTM